MKSKEELKQISGEYNALNGKLAELSEEELKPVAGGRGCSVYCWECGYDFGPRIYRGPEDPMEYCPVCKKKVKVH